MSTEYLSIYLCLQFLSTMSYTVSLLHTNLQVSNFQRYECVSRVQSCKLVHTSGIHCHVHASSTSGCAFVYFTVLCRVQQYSIFYFKPSMSGSKRKSSSDVAGTAVLFKVCFFMYYLCERYYKPITVQYYIANCVSWVPRLTLNKLDLQTYSQNGTRLYVGDLLQFPMSKSFISLVKFIPRYFILLYGNCK